MSGKFDLFLGAVLLDAPEGFARKLSMHSAREAAGFTRSPACLRPWSNNPSQRQAGQKNDTTDEDDEDQEEEEEETESDEEVEEEDSGVAQELHCWVISCFTYLSLCCRTLHEDCEYNASDSAK